MFKLPKFSKPKKEASFLVLDLGTSAAKAGIFRKQEIGKATTVEEDLETDTKSSSHLEILALSRQPHGQTSFRGHQIYQVDAVLETCSLAIERVTLESGINPTRSILLASAFTRTVSTNVKLRRAEPESEISESELDGILQRIEQQTADHAYQKAARLFTNASGQFSLPEELHRLESKITGFQLDDKKLESPVGFSGNELKVSLNEQFCLKKEHALLTKIIGTLDLEIKKISSAALGPLNFLMPHYPRGILVDIGGRITEVILFNENNIESNAFFNWGGTHLTWNLMRHFDLAYDSAERLKIAISQDNLEIQKQKAAEDLTRAWLEILLVGICESLGTLNITSLPENVFISGGGSRVKHLKSAFIAYPWTKKLPFTAFPKPKLIDITETASLTGKESEARKPEYAGIIGAALS